jgi:hypothetical protein
MAKEADAEMLAYLLELAKLEADEFSQIMAQEDDRR